MQKSDFEFIANKLKNLVNDEADIYYIPSSNQMFARGMLQHSFNTERTNLSRKNLIKTRKRVRRVPIDFELSANGMY